MAQNFLACERDQQYLMPPSLREWLPEGHLAWFILDAVAEMDLSAFYACYRDDGWGRAAYAPEMMVALTLYSYCLGERSSRRIERRLGEDIAYRVIAANQSPDHTTIARFRQHNEGALAGLFTEILRLCAGAGMVKVGVVAIDGTKMAASASLAANRSKDAIEAEVRRILTEAAETDAAEDALYGEGVRGDELPPELADRRSRLARLKEAKRRLEEEDAARQRAHQEHLAERERIERERGTRLRGRKPKPPAPAPAAKANTTDPDSRILKCPDRFIQGYNAQAAVGPNQIILAAEITPKANDVAELHPMIAATEKSLHAVGIPTPTPRAPSFSSPPPRAGSSVRPPVMHPRRAGGSLRACRPASGWRESFSPRAARPSTACAARPSSPSSARSRSPAASGASCAAGYLPARASGG